MARAVGHPDVTRRDAPVRTPRRDAYLFPSARNPRLLVPADVPAAATMLQRLGNDKAASPARCARSCSARSGPQPSRWLAGRSCECPGADPHADSIENHLAGVLGTEVRVGVMLGPRRVNQKPVLQIFGLDGTLGYAKVGHNALTAALVRHEADSLRA